MKFELNKQLEKDTYFIKETKAYILLLNKNALVPWLILVPKTDFLELFQCDSEFKNHIREALDFYSDIMDKALKPDKINIATIGNIVPQLHIHIICRYKTDFAWPSPVWGHNDFMDYTDEQIDMIKDILR